MANRPAIVLLLTAMLIALGGLAPASAAPPAASPAQAAPVAPYPFVFVGGTDRQRNDVLRAIGVTDFDYGRIGTTITVQWVAGLRARTGYYGTFSSNSKITLDGALRSRRAGQVFSAEAWHAVDIHVLTTEDRQALIAVAHGGVYPPPDGHLWWETAYRDSLAETLMDSFIASYTPYRDTGLYWTHPATPELAAELRRVLDAS